MESILTEKEYRRYLLKKCCGGRTKLARILDAVFLRLLLFGGGYLFFATRIQKPWIPLLLALVFLALVCLILRIVREIRLERQTEKELSRIRGILLSDKLLLLPAAAARKLCAPLCGKDETPVFLPRVKPADSEAVLSVIRSRHVPGKPVLFCCAGFSEDAKALAARMEPSVRLGKTSDLLDVARAAGLTPGQAEVRAYIAAEINRQKHRRRAVLPNLTNAGISGKYWITALVLMAVSFFTRYALYYRLLAGVCMSIAAAGTLLQNAHRGQPS